MNIGTKANNLHIMKAHNINVPWFVCIKWEDLVKSPEKIYELFNEIEYDDYGSLEKASEKLKNKVEYIIRNEYKLDESLIEDYEAYSIRSSSVNEDGELSSFAGQFDTYLNIKKEHITEYIIKCCMSLYNVNVLKYCNEQKISLTELKMNVIVQKMIVPQYSGILFTANPQGLLNESVIVVGEGIGENVVSDRVDTTTYYYNTTDNVYYYEPQGEGIILGNDIVCGLIHISKDIQELFGKYVDIEFAIKDNEIFILQARKITTIDDSKVVILDNSNIVESYPGITLPLSDSFVNIAYTGVFKGVASRVVKNSKLIDKYDEVFKNMVGSCNGRMYYKISNWYTVLKFMPFRKKIIKNWQEMLGVSNKNYDSSKIKMTFKDRIGVYFNTIYEITHIQKNMDRLNNSFIQINQTFKEEFNKGLSNKELLELYEKIKTDILYDWDITLLNDMYAFVFTGLLKAMLKQDKVPDYEVVVNSYISGITNIESIKPIRGILNLAKMYIEVKEHKCNRLDYENAVKEYIDEYGDRALEELKLESKTFRSNPELLYEKIENYAQDEEKLYSMLKSMNCTNNEIDESALKKVCGIDKAIICFLSKKAMKGIQSREISRLNRSRIYGFVRSIFTQIGKNLAREGKLDNYEDIFYVKIDEICSMVNNNYNLELRPLVIERKQKYMIYKEMPAYSRLVFTNNVFDKNHMRVNSSSIHENIKNLKGIPCSKGKVEGEAMVITDVTNAKNVKDKILVTKMTDPGWVFLLVEAKGIIAEKGSLLSHTAIISRELGIPSVVGVTNVCNKLRTGDKVILDGDTGEIFLSSDD